MSAATLLDYADRCERYARRRGWNYDEHELSIGHLTPAQRRRALKKERSQRAAMRRGRGPALPPADEWNAAVQHSLDNPAHVLGPYEGDDGLMHMYCDGSGDPYEPSNCDFTTAPGSLR